MLSCMYVKQGDQKSLWKNRPKGSPTYSLSKLVHNLNEYVVESSPKVRATSLIFMNLPKLKFRPLNENSPNLVTLMYVKWHNMHCYSVEIGNKKK
jgi:hypothetical protein